MTDQDTEFTLTIKSIDRNEINDFLNSHKYKMALNDIKQMFRGTEKYEWDNLSKLNAEDVFDKIKKAFWNIIEDNEINLD